MRRRGFNLGLALAIGLGLALEPALDAVMGPAMAQEIGPQRGGRGFGGGGLGIGLGVGLGAAVLGGILATQRAQPGPRIIEGGPDEGQIPTVRTTHLPRHPHLPTQPIHPPRPPRPPTQTVQAVPPNPGVVVPVRSEQRYVQDEILVVTQGDVSPTRRRRLEATFGLTSLASAHIDLLDADIRRYGLRPGAAVGSTLGLLRTQRGIAGAEPNYLFELQDDAAMPPSAPTPDEAAKSEPPTAEQATPGMPLQYAVTSLHLDAAHKVANGDNVLVAVIDSGVDETNPELQGMVADRFDAVGGTFAPQAHGTAMGGAIVAHRALIGAAPKARLLAIRAFTGGKQSANGTGFDILRGLDFAATHGARIVNMSFAGPRDQLLEQALVAAQGRGIVTLAAAGNAGPSAKPLFPAAGPGVIAITATDAEGKPFAQANRGAYIAAAAPGVDIIVPGLGQSVQLTSGTSVATAEASGVVALILERNAKAGPVEIRRILTHTAHPLTSEPDAAGAGLIDAAAAVSTTK